MLWCVQVDVYSFSMIMFQLFEHNPPFAGVDPVEAARLAALYDKRPNLNQISEKKPFPFNVRALAVVMYLPLYSPCQCRNDPMKSSLSCRLVPPWAAKPLRPCIGIAFLTSSGGYRCEHAPVH